MIIYITLLSLIAGSYLLKNPLIGVILCVFLVLLIRKEKTKKNIIISVVMFNLFFIKCLLFRLNVFTNFGIVTCSKENYFIIYNGISKFYISCKNNPYELFDIVQINGFLKDYSFTTYESQFDFNKYLFNKLIYKQIDYNSIGTFLESPIKINKFFNSFIMKFNEEGRIIVSKLLFSKNYDSSYSSFVNSNSLSYLLSISSLHLYYLSNFLKTLFESKLKEKTSNKIILVIYILLTFISSFKIGVFRFVVYQIVTLINDSKKLELPYLKRVGVTLIVLAIIDQSYVFSSGFIFNLILPIFFVLSRDGLSTINYKYKDLIRTILIYLLIFLLNIIFNENFSPLSILLIPVFTFIILIVMSVSLLSIVLPFENIVSFLSLGLIRLFEFIDKINITIYVSNRNYVFIFIYILCIVLFILFLENKRKKLQKLVIMFFLFNLILTKIPIKSYLTTGVYFINVGQGDSILIHDRNTNILVDTGGVKNKDIAQESLIPFLKKKNIYSLDYVFLTHQDYDHVGGFESLKDNFIIKNYNTSNDFSNIYINNIKFSNLNPSSNNQENDDSIVLYFTLNDIDYLLLGDVSEKIEKKIVHNYPNLNVDVIKIGHHGSSSSTCELLLQTYDMDVAIISCGKNNYYNHPSIEVIKRLNKHQITIRRTDEEGTIYIKKLKK